MMVAVTRLPVVALRSSMTGRAGCGSAFQMARASLASSTAAPKSAQHDQAEVIYTGQLTDAVKLLKRVSVTTCGMSMVGMPMLLVAGSHTVPMVGQLAITGVAMLAAVGSTAVLHLFTSPYIHKLSEITPEHGVKAGLEPEPEGGGGGGGGGGEGGGTGVHSKGMGAGGDRQFVAEHINIVAWPVSTTFSLSDVEPLPNALRPFVTFRAKGRYFFVQGEYLDDKPLLKQLVGRPLKDSEK